MALSFSGASVPVGINGDGTSSEITIDLTKVPLRIDLSGNAPVAVDLGGYQGASATLVGNSKVKIMFDSPLANGEQVSMQIQLWFQD